ncbi:MAG: hypothetical protein JOZ62_23945 [Acidobacteriaceae bacterium]|nr:hypothetical protein [Acidobacteriaceae bacterium]
MSLKLLICSMAGVACFAAGDPVAARLAKEARQARNSGQLVRAYLLYAEAAARDPRSPTYRQNRDALAPAAKLLTESKVQNADISKDVKAAESVPGSSDAESAMDIASAAALEPADNPQPPPALEFSDAMHSFDLRLDEKSMIAEVAQAYGVKAIFDPAFNSKPAMRFAIDRADFRTAMEGLTASTQTFVFPVTANTIFVARDTQTKRDEFEPSIIVTVPLPEALDAKEMMEAANAVRSSLSLRSIAWDTAGRTLVIHDRVAKARIARSLLETVILPRAQVSLEVQVLAVNSDTTYHYGLALPTSFPVVSSARIGGFQTLLPTFTSATKLLTFGADHFFGVGLADATLFALYTQSTSRSLFDATVVVEDRQTATLHVGDKYPIPQSIYSGFQQSGGSIYNPIGQVSLEDLGLVLKLGARVNGEADISLDVDAEFRSLGTLTLDTIPAIAEREFKGNVRLREGEWAVIAGMEEAEHTASRNGLPGLAQIPGLNHFLSENNRENTSSNTLVVIKPTITRLPMPSTISPQFLIGPQRGTRVLF